MDPRSNNNKNFQTGSPQVNRVRRIGGERINDDWAYLNEEEFDPYESTDKTFNRNYRHRGLGRGGNDESENIEGFYQNSNDQGHGASITDKQSAANYEQNRKSQRARKAILTALEETKTIQKGLGLANKRKTVAVTRSIIYWGGYIWLFVQVPIALFGIILFAIIGGLSQLGLAIDSNFITSTLNSAASVVGGIIGFQIGDVLEAFFYITYILILAIGMITTLCIFIQHSLTLNRPLSGRGTSWKIGALILAFIGYATPVVNILPWALPWVLAIGKYPR